MQARYTQQPLGFAPFTSKTLVNSRSNKVVNIASTKMMKEFWEGGVDSSPRDTTEFGSDTRRRALKKTGAVFSAIHIAIARRVHN